MALEVQAVGREGAVERLEGREGGPDAGRDGAVGLGDEALDGLLESGRLAVAAHGSARRQHRLGHARRRFFCGSHYRRGQTRGGGRAGNAGAPCEESAPACHVCWSGSRAPRRFDTIIAVHFCFSFRTSGNPRVSQAARVAKPSYGGKQDWTIGMRRTRKRGDQRHDRSDELAARRARGPEKLSSIAVARAAAPLAERVSELWFTASESSVAASSRGKLRVTEKKPPASSFDARGKSKGERRKGKRPFRPGRCYFRLPPFAFRLRAGRAGAASGRRNTAPLLPGDA